jgi:hypothetical protein
MRQFIVVVVLVVLGSARAANAQEIGLPPRLSQPPVANPGQTVKQLWISTNLFGGYDHNVIPPPVIAGPGPTPSLDNYTAQGAVALGYSIARGKRSLDLAGDGSLTTRPVSARTTPGPMYGVNVDASFRTPLGPIGDSFVRLGAGRNPFYSMGVFGAMQPGMSYLPESSPVNGVFDGFLRSVDSAAGLSHSWSRRTTTSLSYTYRRDLHEGGVTEPMDYVLHGASVDITQQVSRRWNVRAGYTASDRASAQAGYQYDDLLQGITAGVTYTRPISPTRTWSITAGGGANQIRVAGGGRYWEPTYNGSFGIDIGRSWVASTSYYQTSYLIESPLSAPDSYLTRTLSFNVGGALNRTLSLALATGASQGDAAAAFSVTGLPGRFTGFFTGVQAAAALGAGWSARVTASYYRSTLQGAASPIAGTPGEFQRASVWAGVDWGVPLYESPRQPRTPGGRVR